ncbi:TetR/AcrR family transcriptional regulator [Actinomadura atramentaria]|uniref:TetR/AcrR family transcriptional regulator n=1 Tax=Actinomadura atramentaria TaxID=1990 RepID=UPI000362D923|nr:TetR/AcrR family transcriptional regulator [Actinomadura atramentaria]
MAQAMAERGFVDTSVGDVLKLAGVSRQTFYQLFSSKLDCFMAAFDAAATLLETRLREAVEAGGTPMEQFERAVGAYAEGLATQPEYARLFLIEAHAAGPAAIERRMEFQELLSTTIAELFGAETDDARFACRAVVAAVGSMVVGPLVRDDPDGVRRIAADTVRHVARLRDAGVL